MEVFVKLQLLNLEGYRDGRFIQRTISHNVFMELSVVDTIKILRPIEDYFEYRNEFKENRKKVTDVIDAYVQTLR